MALGSESEIRKDRTFPGGGHLFRVYLDNFDELKKVNRHLAETIEGKLSAMSLGLREEYLRLQIPRHPKKSVQQQRVAEVQGAIVDGSRGLAYPKPEKVMKYCQLACHLLARGRCTQRQAQVIGGGFVYLAMFRRPLLGSMNALWQFIVSFEHFPPVISLDIPEAVKEELARFVGLSPLSVVNFRLDLSQCVTASDASEYGGGVTFSRGLTEAGACAARCSVRGDIVEPLEVESVLTVGLFDGISALRVAVDSLGWNILGHVSVESNEEARRVVESRFPSTRFVTDIVLVDEAEVKEWACLLSQASLVLLGSGAPCQGVSQLNAQWKGALRDSRSALFQHVPRVKALVQKFFPWARVASLAENVASMDEQDRKVMTEAFGDTPWMIDGKDFSIARRPRLYWFDWELVAQEGVTLQLSRDSSSSACHTAKVLAQVDERDYLHPGWARQEVQPLPTFTTSRCRDYEGHRPAGKAQCQAHELKRWKADHYRYPPYQYQDKNCLQQRSSGELRLPDIEERECIMGFPRGYTMQAMKKTLHNTPGHLASRLSMIGNSWNVIVVAWILNHLGYLLGFHPLLSPQQIVERTAPGSTHSLQAFLQRPPMRQHSTKVRGQLGHQLVRKLSSLVSLKGEDLLLQAGSEDLVRYQRMRASLPARLWRWRVASSWQWRGGREHINVLEMRAVLNALRWRLERQSQVKIKFVHMVDSLVCLHSLSRGRSSSRKLRRTLLRVNSLLLATGSSVVWSYVHTSLNPADAPSRRPRKRKWANA
jgi:site-specific DNA-cytosine methylase